MNILTDLVPTVRSQSRSTELRAILSRWKDMADMTSRLLTLCNSYSPHDLREVPVLILSSLVLRLHVTFVSYVFILSLSHPCFLRMSWTSGPLPPAKSVRPPRPMLQLAVPANQLESPHGQDPEYDLSLKV